MITLRENQKEPIDKAIAFFRSKNPDPSLIVLPTAWGKSILTAFVAKEIGEKILILQPTKELLEQNYKKYSTFGSYASVYSASFGVKEIGEVTYATIGSIQSIGKKFKEHGFKYLLVDEAHLYPRESNSMFGRFLKDSEITHVLGITATPLKLQTNRGLDGNTFSKLVMLTSKSKKGNFFKDIIHVGQISEMVENNFWSKLVYDKVSYDTTGLVFNSTKAEFTEESITKVYQNNDIETKVLDAITLLKERKRILIFVPSVSEAIYLSSLCESSCAIYGDMDKLDRDRKINAFKNGKMRIIFNFNVLSVGFDCPEIDCIIMARSTASLSWYYQAIGRATRISPQKNDCLILDMGGCLDRFGKVEHLVYKKEGQLWKLYGEGGKLLTGIPIHEIGNHNEETEEIKTKKEKASKEKDPSKIEMTFGKHKGEFLLNIPKSYRSWMLENVTWNSGNMHIKKGIQSLQNI